MIPLQPPSLFGRQRCAYTHVVKQMGSILRMFVLGSLVMSLSFGSIVHWSSHLPEERLAWLEFGCTTHSALTDNTASDTCNSLQSPSPEPREPIPERHDNCPICHSLGTGVPAVTDLPAPIYTDEFLLSVDGLPADRVINLTLLSRHSPRDPPRHA